jgi:anaerobic magnesium-protoporphyrin IX monomethyl ester cyclase
MSETNKLIIIADARQPTNNHKNDFKKNGKALYKKLIIDDLALDPFDLVNFSNFELKNIPEVLSKENHITLNGVFLSEYCRSNGYETVLIKDFFSSSQLLQEELSKDPFAVLISTTFLDMTKLELVLSFIKESRNPKTNIVCGGPFIFSLFQEYPDFLTFAPKVFWDAYYITETKGEKSLVKLLTFLSKDNKNFSEIANVQFINMQGKIRKTKIEKEITDVNDFIMSWKEIPEIKGSSIAPIRTSCGCPFRCEFCTYWKKNPNPTYVKIENIERELRSLKQCQSIKHIIITDDLINVTKKRLTEICTAFIKNNIHIGWSAFFRSKPIDEESAQMLKEAGCTLLSIGFESFSNEILRNMNKNETVEDHLECISLLQSVDIAILGSFVVGFPGETLDTINETIQIINKSSIDFAELYGFVYFPESPVATKAHHYNLSGAYSKWSHDSMSSSQVTEIVLPKMALEIDNIGLIEWDNWGLISLLLSYGYSIKDISEIFNLWRLLIKKQIKNASTLTLQDMHVTESMQKICKITKFKEAL